MQEVFIAFLNQFGYAGVGLLIFVENIFPPIPSEVVLLFSGFMTTYSDLHPWAVVFCATLGSFAGACVLYAVGRLLDAEKLKRLLSGRLGRITQLHAEDVEKANTWFLRYSYPAVLLCRCVPIVRSLISLPAGMAHMPFLPFAGLTLAGTVVWNTVLVWLGRFSSAAWEQNLQYFSVYSKLALAVFAAAAVIAAFVLYHKKKRAAKKASTETP